MNKLAITECKGIKESFKTNVNDHYDNTYENRAAQRKESLVSDFELGFQLQTKESFRWQRENQILLNAFSQHRTKKSHEPACCSMTSAKRRGIDDDEFEM